MVFVLFYNNDVYGCYGTLDLLRYNILIILYNLYEKSIIDTDLYENIMTYFESEYFNVNTFGIEDLKNNLHKCKFRIEEIDYERSGKYAIENILGHIEYRFNQLENLMKKDVRNKITFPGTSPENHKLCDFYFPSWNLMDKENYHLLTKSLQDFIAIRMNELKKTYPDRVKFGDVVYENANPNHFQVWGANAKNWNLPEGSKIPGKFQALQMKYQEPGVFGIVVTPLYGYHNLVPLEDDKKLSLTS